MDENLHLFRDLVCNDINYDVDFPVNEGCFETSSRNTTFHHEDITGIDESEMSLDFLGEVFDNLDYILEPSNNNVLIEQKNQDNAVNSAFPENSKVPSFRKFFGPPEEIQTNNHTQVWRGEFMPSDNQANDFQGQYHGISYYSNQCEMFQNDIALYPEFNEGCHENNYNNGAQMVQFSDNIVCGDNEFQGQYPEFNEGCDENYYNKDAQTVQFSDNIVCGDNEFHSRKRKTQHTKGKIPKPKKTRIEREMMQPAYFYGDECKMRTCEDHIDITEGVSWNKPPKKKTGDDKKPCINCTNCAMRNQACGSQPGLGVCLRCIKDGCCCAWDSRWKSYIDLPNAHVPKKWNIDIIKISPYRLGP